MGTPERVKKAKREYMRRSRLDPIKRDRWNELRRQNPNRQRWSQDKKERLKKMRENQFFKWRARLYRTRFKIKITAHQLAKMWKLQRGLCALSGRKLTRDSAHLDHITPITRGGEHTLSNFRWVDFEVNLAKRNLTDSEFLVLCESVAYWIAKRIMNYEANH